MLPLIKTILHPTDFSERADPAFRLACSLAKDYDARLIIQHVVDQPMAVSGVGVIFIPPQVDEEPLREKLRDLQERFPQVHMELRLVHGNPAAETLRTAREMGCDLIVMGTHGRSGVGRLMLGSVAEEVIRKAVCPVMTVKDLPADQRLFGELVGEAASRAMGARDA